MDNDNIYKKKIVNIYKGIRFYLDYHDKNVLSEEKGNNLINQLLTDDGPIMISRFGATEARCLEYFIHKRAYDNGIKSNIKNLSGVYPTSNEFLNKFCEFYLMCSKSIDALAVWQVKNERYYVDNYCSNAKLIRLRSLEPYYFENPWSKSLKDKRILIIHPFDQSILEQYKKRELLFCNNDILPRFKSIEVVKSVQSVAGEIPQYDDWFEAYDYMCKKIDEKNFDIAIIGAGAYGLPLAYHVKSIGKKAIHMAGATQIMFGIKGKRWDNHSYISKLYNSHWIRPSESETPKKYEIVEGGSYW
jgi:hypothetical protein